MTKDNRWLKLLKAIILRMEGHDPDVVGDWLGEGKPPSFPMGAGVVGSGTGGSVLVIEVGDGVLLAC